jgi:hypothetical protein
MRSTDDAEPDYFIKPPQHRDAPIRVADGLISYKLMPHCRGGCGEERQADQPGNSGAADHNLQADPEPADKKQPPEDDNDGDKAPDFDRDG